MKKQRFTKYELNEQQQAIVEWTDGPLLVSANAGSGKTSTVIHRIIKLIDSGVHPSNILATTFTRKAANEMNDRLDAKGVNTKRMSVQTMHSLCWQLILKQKKYKHWTLDDKGAATTVLKIVLGYKDMNWKSHDLSLVERFISLARNHLIEPSKSRTFMQDAYQFEHQLYAEAYIRYAKAMSKKNLMTFDDMLYYGVKLVQKDKKVLDKLRGQYHYVIIDEFQDSNHAQIVLGDLIAKPLLNYMVVGDIDQCQPPDTMVWTKNGYVPISTLKTGNTVKVWNRNAARITGTQPITIASREYSGSMHTIETASYSTRATYNHIFIVRWERFVDRWVVYLMYKKDLGYRIGWCKLFTNAPRTFHLAQRARIEEADAAWILKVFDTPKEASIYESITSIKWRIPTAMFKPIKQAQYYDIEAIQRIFDTADITDAWLCLEEHNLHKGYPLYVRNDRIKKGTTWGKIRGTIFETAACNVIPNLMYVPVEDDTWQPVTNNSIKHYVGEVYSLDVNVHKNYIADGIVTHNSIYQFRGSVPEFMLEFQKQYDAEMLTLDTNYRCAPGILRAAELCIGHNEKRIPKPLIPHRTKKAFVAFKQPFDCNEEAGLIREEIELLHADGLNYSGMAVLMRMNSQSRAIEEELIRFKIPFIVLGGGSFYERKEIKDLLSYLRLIVDPHNIEAGERAINRPFRKIARYNLDEIRDRVGRKCTYIQAADKILSWNKPTDFIELVEAYSSSDDPAYVLRTIVDTTGYIEYLQEAEGSETLETSREDNIDELTRSAGRFKTIEEFIDYVDTQIRLRKRNMRKQTGSKVQIGTVHKVKGLEYNTVFLIGVNEDIMPHKKGDEEEERRIFYVAVTRAKDRLYVTSPTGLGEINRRPLLASRFVFEAQLDNQRKNLTKKVVKAIVPESSEGKDDHSTVVQSSRMEDLHR